MLARLLTAPADDLDPIRAVPGACPLAAARTAPPRTGALVPAPAGSAPGTGPAAAYAAEQAVSRLGETTERLLLRHLRDGRPAARRPALDAPSTTTEITRRERRALPGRPAGVPASRGR